MQICVTGIGIISPLGKSAEEFWANVVAGRCGIAPIELFDTAWLPCTIAGEVKNYRPEASLGPWALDLTRSDQFAVQTVGEAIAQSGFDLGSADRSRVGISFGTCQGAVGELASHDPGRSSKMFMESSADEVARHFGIAGPRFVASNACAAGACAVAVAVETLLAGDADVMIAAGADGLTFFTLAGFSVLQSLDSEPCSPYGRSAGLSVGEGAAAIVLESQEHAERRGVKPLADLLGYGLSADAYHPTAPDPTGRGAALAVRRALSAASLEPADVSYVNGHGTGTAANDAMERKAFKLVFGERAPAVAVSSTKSMIGHLLGAAGLAEAVTCVLAIQNGVLPPTVNMPDRVDDGFDFVANHARPADVDVAVSSSYAFGGANASLVLGRPRPRRRPASAQPSHQPEHEVVITGVGTVGGLGFGFDEWRDALKSGQTSVGAIEGFDAAPYGNPLAAEAPALSPRQVASGTAFRKMDQFARLCVASGRLAWEDSGLVLTPAEKEDVGLVFATATGSLDVITQFDRSARHDPANASPKLFPHTSLNSAAGHLCTLLGIRGPTLSITSGGVSGLGALSYATQLIRRGTCDVVMVTAGDEFGEATLASVHAGGVLPLTRSKVRPFDRDADGTALGAAAVTLVLESRAHAEERQARVRANVLGTVVLGGQPDWDRSTTWQRVLERLVVRSGTAADAVGYCAASANGDRPSDVAELTALGRVFADGIDVSAVKSLTGDTLGTAGLVNVVAAICAVGEDRLMAPTANLEQPVEVPAVRHVLSARPSVADIALATASSPASGIAGALIAAP